MNTESVLRKSESILRKAKLLAKDSGLTYQQIGEKMGYPKDSARQSVSQFLCGTNPSLHMLIRFSDAIGKSVRKLL